MECGWIRCLRGLSWGRKVPSDWWQGTGSESFLVEIKFGAQDSSHGSESFLLWLIKHPHLDHNNGTTLSQRFCDCLIYIVLIWRTKDEGYSKIVGRVSKRETECVRLCEQRDGVEEKCDNRSEQKGRVEVEEMLRAVNGGRKATRCGAE